MRELDIASEQCQEIEHNAPVCNEEHEDFDGKLCVRTVMACVAEIGIDFLTCVKSD